jgi:hypothetical protein
MASLGQWTRAVLTPSDLPQRPRWLHWVAWAASIASFVLILSLYGAPAWFQPFVVQQIDLWTSVFFAVEFFTRSGFRKDTWRYARWRWFDLLGLVPVLFLQPYVEFYSWFLILVLVARGARVLDRTLGDGFVKRNFLALIEAVEEETSDRVLEKIMARIENELAKAQFGTAAAAAIAKNRDAILQRIYQEQMAETGALGKVAIFTGVQSALEKAEARAFDAIIKVVGSPETDQLIREIIQGSLSTARSQIGKRSWTSKMGLGPAAPVEAKPSS